MIKNTPWVSSDEIISSLQAWIKKSWIKNLQDIDFSSWDIKNEIDICLFPEKIESRFSNLINTHFINEKEIFYKAINFIKQKHSWQYRDENTPYFCHLIITAIYCFENGWWENEILASLLHDVLEDTDTKYEEINNIFWKEVADLVKLVSFSVDWKIVEEKKYYEEIVKSPWALLIKWSDRLSNIYSTMFTKNKEWKEWYFERTRTQVIPIIWDLYPKLASKIEDTIFYLENNNLSDEQEQRVYELEKIKNIKNEINSNEKQ